MVEIINTFYNVNKKVNIIEWLNDKGLEPKCTTFGVQHSNPNIIFDYNNNKDYLHLKSSSPRQSIEVDLQTIVPIYSYKITSYNRCNWLHEWDFDVSINGDQLATITEICKIH